VRAQLSFASRVKARFKSRATTRHQSERPTSFPYISGDTFRAIADVRVEKSVNRWPAQEVTSTPHIVFCEPDLLGWLNRSEAFWTRDAVLIVHNGDIVPESELLAAADRFTRTFAVNWLGEHPSIDPVPIGLENLWHGMNGRLDVFDDIAARCRDDAASSETREILALNSYYLGTNLPARTAAMSTFTRVPGVLTPDSRLKPSRHAHLLKKSLFVVSPPGNGPDCHRTWEAIYQGAVPIVLRRAWPFDHLSLPVLVVDDWDTARELLAPDPHGLYRELRSRQASPAYFPFHMMRVQRALSPGDRGPL
jgi:hypothetical protein